MDKDKSDLDLGARSLLPLTICGTRISGSSTAIPILEIDGASAFLPSLLPREGRLSPAPPPPGSFSGQIPAQKNQSCCCYLLRYHSSAPGGFTPTRDLRSFP